MRRLAVLMLVLLPGGCASPPAALPTDPAPRPPVGAGTFTLGAVTVDITPGTAIGGYGFDLLCAPPYHDLVWNPPSGGGAALRAAVRDGLAGAGTGPTTGPGSTLPVLSARVTALSYDLCRRRDFWFGRSIGDSGSARVSVTWSLDGAGRPPFSVLTTGTGTSDAPALRDTRQLLLGLALADAAAQLAGRTDFRQAAAARNPPAPAMASEMPAAGGPAAIDEGRAEGTAMAAGADSPLVRVRLGRASLPAIRIGSDGLALLRWGRRDPLPAIGDPVTLATGEPGMVAATDAPTGTALLRLAPCACAAVEWRERSPAVSSPLQAPGAATAPVMVAARRETEPMALLLVDPGLLAEPPPFLLDMAGRLAAVRAGPAAPGGLAPYFPAGPVLTRLQAGMATGPARQEPETQKAG